MRRKEFLVSGPTKASAISKCSREIRKYLRDRTDWKMLICEAKKHAGKWECRAKVQVGA